MKLFIPGDVPYSTEHQKRTAEYKVQSLTMGVPNGGKTYNAAFLSVPVPKKDDNLHRGIPLDKISHRKVEGVETDFNPFSSRDIQQSVVFITNYTTRNLYSYNLSTKKIVQISSLPIDQMRGLYQHPRDVTLTLQGTYLSAYLAL